MSPRPINKKITSVHTLPFSEDLEMQKSLVSRCETRICDLKHTFVFNKRCMKEYLERLWCFERRGSGDARGSWNVFSGAEGP
jgi:hypothetical protein